VRAGGLGIDTLSYEHASAGVTVSLALSAEYDRCRHRHDLGLREPDRLGLSDVLAELALEFSAHPGLEFVFGNIIVRKQGQEIFKRQRCINRVTLPFEDLSHEVVFARRELFLRIG
jgi:hypothetical protein